MTRKMPVRTLLMLLCPMMVLVFLYWSAGRMGLCVRSTKPLYDKQGFLLKLDGKLPPELMYKYGNLSHSDCKPGFASAKMSAIYPKLGLNTSSRSLQWGSLDENKRLDSHAHWNRIHGEKSDWYNQHGPSNIDEWFFKPAPIFLDPNFRRFSRINSYIPPFGLRTQEKNIDIILSETKSFGLGPELDSLSCKRCVIVGNGGILFNKSVGSVIDTYDVVVRLNMAPVRGYERDVGSKTTMRITYPEGAFQRPELYEKESLFVLSAFKPADLKWLQHMLRKERLYGTAGFWKPVPQSVPREPHDVRILNPYFIQEAAFKLIGLPYHNGQMGSGNIPTLGTVAITMALHNCDEVAVAGFGYDMTTPYAPIHYYESIRMAAIKESWTHNISKEKEFLVKLVKAGVITDLTHGI